MTSIKMVYYVKQNAKKTRSKNIHLKSYENNNIILSLDAEAAIRNA